MCLRQTLTLVCGCPIICLDSSLVSRPPIAVRLVKLVVWVVLVMLVVPVILVMLVTLVVLVMLVVLVVVIFFPWITSLAQSGVGDAGG